MKRISETHRLPGHPDPHKPPRPFSKTGDWPLRSALLAGLVLGVCGGASARAADLYDETTRQSLVAAVEAASVVDLYHARCRGDVSGRQTENLNKLLVSKLRITVLTVKDDLFPERSYRRAEERLEQDFATVLREAGGCQGAKESPRPEQWKTRYEATLDAIRALP
ncbi:hypothetical protein [uncultured Thiocystis sp.]|uniref:hypothetical protein n=1 Tax=uncultured Thiocystis sp. TaxID=1202134 RepID=UPI0025DB867A|nr:hypothetical protein [uncultured Thiocystis sp.]